MCCLADTHVRHAIPSGAVLAAWLCGGPVFEHRTRAFALGVSWASRGWRNLADKNTFDQKGKNQRAAVQRTMRSGVDGCDVLDRGLGKAGDAAWPNGERRSRRGKGAVGGQTAGRRGGGLTAQGERARWC